MKNIPIRLVLLGLFAALPSKAQLPYKIVDKYRLRKIETAKRDLIDSFYIIDYNSVFVTTYKDGTATLAPPVLGGDEGMVFSNIPAMNAMIKSRVYPVKGTGSFWEKERDRIVNLNDSMPYYYSALTNMLDFSIEPNLNADYLDKLSIVINQKLKAGKSDLIIKDYLTIYIADLIRRSVDGEWRLFIVPAFNPSYVPEVVKANEFFAPDTHVFGKLTIAKYRPIDVKTMIVEAHKQFLPCNERRYR